MSHISMYGTSITTIISFKFIDKMCILKVTEELNEYYAVHGYEQ